MLDLFREERDQALKTLFDCQNQCNALLLRVRELEARAPELTDDQLDNIIHDLNTYANDRCGAEYGLPLYDRDKTIVMRQIIRKAISGPTKLEQVTLALHQIVDVVSNDPDSASAASFALDMARGMLKELE